MMRRVFEHGEKRWDGADGVDDLSEWMNEFHESAGAALR